MSDDDETFVEPTVTETIVSRDPRKVAVAMSEQLAAVLKIRHRMLIHRCGTVFYLVAPDGKAIKFTRS
jgi:hypothetical protein